MKKSCYLTIEFDNHRFKIFATVDQSLELFYSMVTKVIIYSHWIDGIKVVTGAFSDLEEKVQSELLNQIERNSCHENHKS